MMQGCKMYIIINRTTGKHTCVAGSFYELAVEMLERDEDIIVISRYSNTVKVPYLEPQSNTYGETKSNLEWKFKDFNCNDII